MPGTAWIHRDGPTAASAIGALFGRVAPVLRRTHRHVAIFIITTTLLVAVAGLRLGLMYEALNGIFVSYLVVRPVPNLGREVAARLFSAVFFICILDLVDHTYCSFLFCGTPPALPPAE